MGKGDGKGRDGEECFIAGVGCGTMWLIIACSLLGTSFDVLKPTEVGIRYNEPGNRMLYDEGIFKNGRHCLSPGHSFEKFTTQLKFVDFMGKRRQACWTKDKQTVHVELGVYYQIDPKGVIKLYKKYGGNYLTAWKSMIKQAIKQSTKYFDTTDFFEARHKILQNITAAIVKQMGDEQVQNVSCIMGNVEIPYEFEAAVTTKVVTQQAEITELMSRNYTLVLADTTLVTADADKRVKVIQANAAARAQIIESEANAQAETLIEQAYADSYAYIQDALNLTETQLMKYIWAQSLRDQSSSAKLVVGFDGSSIKTST